MRAVAFVVSCAPLLTHVAHSCTYPHTHAHPPPPTHGHTCSHTYALTYTHVHTRRAIENGANALAESFLFAVAAALILGESYRTSSKQSKRRDDVDDKLEGLASAVERLQQDKVEVEHALEQSREEVEGERKRREALEKVVERLVGVGIGLGGNTLDASVLQGTPLQPPRTVETRTDP